MSTQLPAPPPRTETMVRTYRNENEYARDAAQLAQDGWRPIFQPTHEPHWGLGVKGHHVLSTVATLGTNMLIPVKRNRLMVTYERTVQ